MKDEYLQIAYFIRNQYSTAKLNMLLSHLKPNEKSIYEYELPCIHITHSTLHIYNLPII